MLYDLFSMEESDQDFYQIDFSTVSDWEIFIARIEEIICNWGLSPNRGGNAYNNNVDSNKESVSADETEAWIVKTEDVTFKYMKFNLCYYRRNCQTVECDPNKNDTIEILENMMTLERDFKTFKLPNSSNNNNNNVECLVQWYGLVDFLALIPSSKTITLTSENDIRMIFSSFSVAVNNVKCELPVFVQVLESWQNFFLGFCANKGVFSDYDMIHLKKVPTNCKYLTGLLNIFKSSIASSFISLDPVKVSVRLSYMLRQNWENLTYRVKPLSDGQQLIDAVEFGRSLPFGFVREPIQSLTLHTTWPELSENIVVDSETYSDLEPQSAPVWSLDVRPIEEQQRNCGALSTCILDYLDKCCCSGTYGSIKVLIGDKYDRIEDVDLSESLSKLTDTELPDRITKLLKKAVNNNDLSISRKHYGDDLPTPISNEVLMAILYFLFPDADRTSRQPYADDDGNDDKTKYYNYNLQYMKSCPVDSLLWRLGLTMLRLMYYSNNNNADSAVYPMAHLWYEFTQELRYRWENSILIPGIGQQKTPDYKTCLLNQKLQLLNCCIKSKIARENRHIEETDDLHGHDCSEEDEFYDCQTTNSNISNQLDSSSWNEPVGRLRKFNNLKLINTGEYMYEPLTQEIAPKTEDQLEEDATLLEQLGTDPYASELRSKLMSVSLCSDMEAFKAANPNAVLEDFIRWYSPRDWIEDDVDDEYGQRKGRLSARMTLPGNVWREVWDDSTPVPAARQKRLFDDTREAGKVLSSLETLSPPDAFRLLLPSIIQIAVINTLENCTQFSVRLCLETRLREFIKKATHLTRFTYFDQTRYKEFAYDIAAVESTISLYKSLEYKLFPESLNDFPDKERILKQLIDGDEIVVPSAAQGEFGNRILIVFSQTKNQSGAKVEFNSGDPYTIFPTPYQKQFILRARTPRPTATSRCLPQKMIAKIFRDQIVIASCFSRDVVYL